MRVELVRANENERVVVKNLSQYYLYDMSEFTAWSPSEAGLYSLDSSIIDPYWFEKEHWPFIIRFDDEIAGFSLLRKHPLYREFMDIGLFYVLRKFKGRGVGREAFLRASEKRFIPN